MKKAINKKVEEQLEEERFNVPVVLEVGENVIRFESIKEAWQKTGISYHLIFECAIEKIQSAAFTKWHFVNENDYYRFKKMYIQPQKSYMKPERFAGKPPVG